MARSKNFFFAKLLKFDNATGKYNFNANEDKFDDNIKTRTSEGTGGLDSDKTLALLSGDVLPAGWTFAKKDDNSLLISYNDSAIVRVATDGEIISDDDVTAFGSM